MIDPNLRPIIFLKIRIEIIDLSDYKVGRILPIDSNAEICESCPLPSQCTTPKNYKKVIRRNVWEVASKKVRENQLSLHSTIYLYYMPNNQL